MGISKRMDGEPLAFSQNQRGEVRDLQDVAGALSAETGMQQQTFVKTSHPRTADDPQGWKEGMVSPTLNTLENANENRATVLAMETECFKLDAARSNAMMSRNPNSGCHREEVSCTLDTTDPSPSKAQGGMAVVERIPCRVSACDANGTRRDRPNGGLYIQRNPGASAALTCGGTPDMVVEKTVHPDVCGSLTAEGADGSPEPEKGKGAKICVLGMKTNHGPKARSDGVGIEVSPTLGEDCGAHVGVGCPGGVVCAEAAGALCCGGHPGGLDGQAAFAGQIIGEPLRRDAQESGCLNPDDPQSKRVYSPGGAMATLCRTCDSTGQATPSVCIPFETRFVRSGSGGAGTPRTDEEVNNALKASSDGTNDGSPCVCVPVVDMGAGKSSVSVTDDLAPTLATTRYGEPAACIPVEGNGHRASHKGDGYGRDGDPSYTLNTVEQHGVAIGIDLNAMSGTPVAMLEESSTLRAQCGGCNGSGVAIGVDRWNQTGHEEVMPTVRSAASGSDGNDADPTVASPVAVHDCAAKTRYAVRRLTPVECERLMGFPDNHTRIAWRWERLARSRPARRKVAEWFTKERNFPIAPEALTDNMVRFYAYENCPDGPRYKACGNSMCVNVMRWIGVRIEMIVNSEKEKKK